MRNIKKFLTSIVCKYGMVIASCAFAAVVITANSACSLPYYEPEEPAGLEKYKIR